MKVLLTLAAGVAVTCLLAGAAGPSAHAARSQGVAYAGQTSQDLPISFVLSRDRRTIKRLDIDWFARAEQCTSGLAYPSGTTFGPRKTRAVKLTSRKRFRHTFLDALTLPDVARIEETPVIRGRVGRTRASGAFRATVIVTDAAGAEINRCDTGTIRWTAVE